MLSALGGNKETEQYQGILLLFLFFFVFLSSWEDI